MLKQVNKHRPFLLRYLLYFIPISPMPHSNICRGAKEIFLYPIRGYSLEGWANICCRTREITNHKSQFILAKNTFYCA